MKILKDNCFWLFLSIDVYLLVSLYQKFNYNDLGYFITINFCVLNYWRQSLKMEIISKK